MLYFSGQTESSLLYRKTKRDEIIPICTGVYTDDKTTPLREQVARNIIDILSHQGLRGTFAYRSSIQFPDFTGDEVIVISDRKRDILLPGIVVHVYSGNDREKNIDFTSRILTRAGTPTQMRVPYIERAILENMLPQRMAEKRADIPLAEKHLGKIQAMYGDMAHIRMSIVSEACGLSAAMPIVSEKLFQLQHTQPILSKPTMRMRAGG